MTCKMIFNCHKKSNKVKDIDKNQHIYDIKKVTKAKNETTSLINCHN